MTLNEIIESAKKNYETRHERLKPSIDQKHSTELPFKTILSSTSGSKSYSKNIPPKSQYYVEPGQKILDPREDAKRIAVDLVDANQGKLIEARRNKVIGNKDIGLTEPEKVGT